LDPQALQALAARLEQGSDEAIGPVLAAAGQGADAAGPEELSQLVLLAARCVDLRARSLLPLPQQQPDDAAPADAEAADPPPEELAERLAAYEVYRSAAEVLRSYEARWSRRFPRAAAAARPSADIDVSLETLLSVFQEIWERARPETRAIAREPLTVEARMRQIGALLSARGAGEGVEFSQLFEGQAARIEVVVTFLALLELARLGRVRVRQEGPSAPLILFWTGRGRASR
jgi:segregation and condensation protein A